MNRKQVNNKLYTTTISIGASRWKQVLWYFTNILVFKSALFINASLKASLLRAFGAKVGKGCVIKPCVNIKYPWKLSMGDYVWIGEEVWIDNLSIVQIGSSVTISQGAMLITGSHNASSEKFDFISLPITLEEGVWIGAKAIVAGGVTCRSHSILGLNSLAEKDMEAYVIYKGNPCIPVIERIIL